MVKTATAQAKVCAVLVSSQGGIVTQRGGAAYPHIWSQLQPETGVEPGEAHGIDGGGGLILMSFQVEPFISTGLQPGVTNRNRNRAASAALPHWAKPLKRLSPPDTPATGLKPGANVKAGLGSS